MRGLVSQGPSERRGGWGQAPSVLITISWREGHSPASQKGVVHLTTLAGVLDTNQLVTVQVLFYNDCPGWIGQLPMLNPVPYPLADAKSF